MKHKVVINVTCEEGQKIQVLKGAIRSLPNRIIKLLFGEYRQVYLLEPGMTVDSVDVREIEKGEKDVKNKATDGRKGRCRESCI
ncbi:MAG: hypothetical protein Q4E02_04990 [Lagierella massiliensis]|nr:hypothetical protein [Lagierella massiliensis]MDO5301083.1 hypothetical protein [Tissierellia bacterium]